MKQNKYICKTHNIGEKPTEWEAKSISAVT